MDLNICTCLVQWLIYIMGIAKKINTVFMLQNCVGALGLNVISLS